MNEIRERFRNLKLEVLEDIVRNQKDDYIEEAYNIAVVELIFQTSNKYVYSILNELQKEPQKENKAKSKKIYDIIAKIIFLILVVLFICINVKGLFWFVECYKNNFIHTFGPNSPFSPIITKVSWVFPIFTIITLLLLIILRKKSNFLRCMLIVMGMFLELSLFVGILYITNK